MRTRIMEKVCVVFCAAVLLLGIVETLLHVWNGGKP
jgi:hypothetical protein